MTSWIEINTFALIHNVKVVRQRCGDIPLWAVVKANAYGHSLAIASEALWRAGVDGWVVTEARDAEWLSQQRYNLPILVLYPLEDAILTYAIESGWHLAVTSAPYFARIVAVAQDVGKSPRLHMEVETGMHRTGIIPVQVERIMAQAEQEKLLVKWAGLFTHLYFADDEDCSQQQMQLMRELQFSLQQKNLPVPMTHVHASTGLAKYGDDDLFDAVRIGQALYGFNPLFPETEGALNWKTRIISTGELKPGETVGYSATFKATKSMRIATLATGYGDGLDRRLGNKGFVLVQGKRCPILGSIGMNQTMIDVSGLMKVEEGEEAVLLGKQGQQAITVYDIADWSGKYEYEIFTGISNSLKRLKAK